MTTSPDDRLGASIAQLFPPDVAISARTSLPANASLLPAERTGTAGMVASRLREFTLGRHCAREALAALGRPEQSIPRAPDRSPVWPAGIVGSISHSGVIAGAVVGRGSAYRGLGLDVESAEALDPNVTALICRPEELTDGTQAKLLFSIKEAIYKAIYPLIGIYVDFQEMEVRLNPATESFSARPHSPNFDPAIMQGLKGKYYRDNMRIICGAWLAKETQAD